MYIPSPTTVLRDVRLVFAKMRERIAGMLREYDGKINFGTDAWTLPNHYAYVALTAHLEAKGEPISIVLDVVEVAKVRDCGVSGHNGHNRWLGSLTPG